MYYRQYNEYLSQIRKVSEAGPTLILKKDETYLKVKNELEYEYSRIRYKR